MKRYPYHFHKRCDKPSIGKLSWSSSDQLAVPAGPSVVHQNIAHAHQTGRGGSPCASRLPACQQLEVSAAAAPLKSSPGT